MHLLHFTNEQVIYVQWRYGQYHRDRVGKRLQLECLRECKLDIDHFRQQRQRQRDSDLFGFSQHQCKFQDNNHYGSREDPHGDPGGSNMHLFHLTDEQAI